MPRHDPLRANWGTGCSARYLSAETRIVKHRSIAFCQIPPMDRHIDLPAALPRAETPHAADSFFFIDLARLGRTDWWSGLKGALKFAGWQLAIGIGLAV